MASVCFLKMEQNNPPPPPPLPPPPAPAPPPPLQRISRNIIKRWEAYHGIPPVEKPSIPLENLTQKQQHFLAQVDRQLTLPPSRIKKEPNHLILVGAAGTGTTCTFLHLALVCIASV